MYTLQRSGDATRVGQPSVVAERLRLHVENSLDSGVVGGVEVGVQGKGAVPLAEIGPVSCQQLI